jgi:hypothetical protein
LKIEQLEARQMMAADLMSTMSTLDGAELDATSRRTSTIQIPITSADPRSYDGTGNNLANPEWGSTDEQLIRIAEADYADGISAPAGEDRPSAREISVAMASQEDETPNERQLSAFIYAWGQFIDHDIDLTLTQATDGEGYNIEVPAGDAYFDPDGSGDDLIYLTRSQYDSSTGISVDNPRAQVTSITSWVDGSMVYGSDQATADSLRTFEGGRLRTSEGDLPPTDEDGNFVAGDIRANENVELTSMHTLFIREHNQWADQIAQQNPGLSDEAIYQQARAIVIAEIQAITFNEFLPALLGEGAISDYQGYDPNVDPSIANEFSTAAFRLGHSMINDDVEFFGDDGRAVQDEISLAEAFFNPAILKESGADSLLKYLASTHSQELDNQIVGSLQNFLFGQPGQGGFDLASLNIQRGRDHGLADYNSVREAYGLSRVTSFAEISSDPEVQLKLEELYGTVDNIDLWVGALAEDHVPGGSTGALVQAIVADQFERLRDGDRFWYENTFSGRSLRAIESTSLSDVIQRNTTVSNLQEDVFFLQSEVRGQVFVDGNSNGRQDRRDDGLRGVAVELLDDEGEVVAMTVTDRSGRYTFATFHETGDYQVRVVVPDRFRATTSSEQDVLVSSGDETLAGVDFGLSMLRRTRSDGDRDRDRRLAAVDAVMAAEPMLDPLDAMMQTGTSRKPRRGAPR